MKLFTAITIFVVAIHIPSTVSQNHALFVRQDPSNNAGKRVTRQTSTDQMVQNILQWLQGVYSENSRRIRQGSLREYLPPSNTQKPRPFDRTTTPGGNENEISGYPAAGSVTPKPPFTIPSGYPSLHPDITPPDNTPNYNGYPSSPKPHPSFPPGPGEVPSTGYPSTGYPSTGPTNGYPGQRPSTGYPDSRPSTGYPDSRPSTGYPDSRPSTGYPGQRPTSPGPTNGYPGSTNGYPGQNTGYPTGPTNGYPTPTTGYPEQTNGYKPSTGGPSSYYPTQPAKPTFPGYPETTPRPDQPSTGYPDSGTQPPSTSFPGYPTPSQPAGPSTTQKPSYTEPTGPNTVYPGPSPSFPTSSPRPFPTIPSTNGPVYTSPGAQTTHDDNNFIPGREPTKPPTPPPVPGEDDKHPPHIHAIDVECSKEMMTINIEFNRQFDGIIYSKGHFNTPECRYVQENSGLTKYTFTVSLNSCGTEFVNAFDTQGQSYLENILVLQNEPGIQEVWDTIRAVRCLWEGNLKKALNVAINVGMLNQEIVTFSGDTAMAQLDIRMGKGPFAPPASGLVKIGEDMTLVVSVTGDAGFDIQVKDCKARDVNNKNSIALTDENGCVLKPKVFGAFQKTRNTQNTGASIIAYAYFQAFKFPDVMDLTIECNVDLCKTDCEMCPDPNQPLEPGLRRRRRDLYAHNSTIQDDSVKMGKSLRVFLPEDLSEVNAIISQNTGVCMSLEGFLFSSSVLILLLTVSCIFSATLWIKYKRLTFKH